MPPTARWPRLLWTRQDFLHLHALSSALFCLYFAAIAVLTLASIATRNDLWTPPDWRIMIPLAFSILVANLSGTAMALRFRRPGAMRRGFLITSSINLYLLWAGLAMTEFYPQSLRGVPAVALTSAYNLLCLGLSLSDSRDLWNANRATRKKNRGEKKKVDPLLSLLTYALPPFIGILLNVLVVALIHPMSSSWAAAYQRLHPAYYAYVMVFILLALFTNSVGSFLVTLRDKGLIGKRGELIAFNLPVVLMVAYVAWTRTVYSDWVPQLTQMLGKLPPV